MYYMNEEQIKTLANTLRMYGKVPAKDSVTGDVLLVNSRADPRYIYIALEDYLKGLEEKGRAINPTTLEIVQGRKPAAKPAPAADPEPELAIPKVPVEQKEPAEKPYWTEEELSELTWPQLRKLGAKHDVKGKSREAITAELIGEAKSK